MTPNGTGGPGQPAWRTASFCASGECLQVAQQDGLIMVRDSTQPHNGTVQWTADEWRSLVRDIKDDRLFS